MKQLEHIEQLHLTPDQEFLVNGLCTGLLHPDGFRSARRWSFQCYHAPRFDEQALCALNEILDGYGVENIPHPNGSDEIGLASYINMGETYQATIVRPYDGHWGVYQDHQVSSWGDFYEGWLNDQARNWNRYQCSHCSYLTELDGEGPYPSGAGISCSSCGHLLFD